MRAYKSFVQSVTLPVVLSLGLGACRDATPASVEPQGRYPTEEREMPLKRGWVPAPERLGTRYGVFDTDGDGYPDTARTQPAKPRSAPAVSD